MSFENNDFTLGTDQNQFPGFENWNPALDDGSGSRSRTSSTNVVSPISDLGLTTNMKSMNASLGLQQTEEMNPSNYLYNIYGKGSSASSGSTSASASTSAPSFQSMFNNGFPIDTSFSNMSASQFMDNTYQDCESHST